MAVRSVPEPFVSGKALRLSNTGFPYKLDKVQDRLGCRCSNLTLAFVSRNGTQIASGHGALPSPSSIGLSAGAHRGGLALDGLTISAPYINVVVVTEITAAVATATSRKGFRDRTRV